MKQVRTSMALGLVALAGCSTPQLPYTEPTAGPTATIHFVDTAGGVNMGIVRLKGEMTGCECSPQVPETIGIFHNKALLVSGHADYADKGKDVSEFTVKVAANGEPFRFVLGMPSYTRDPRPGWTGWIDFNYCQAHQSFVPMPGKKYEITYDASSSMYCELKVEVERDGAYVPVATTRYPMCALYPGGSDGVSDRIRQVCKAHPDVYKSPR